MGQRQLRVEDAQYMYVCSVTITSSTADKSLTRSDMRAFLLGVPKVVVGFRDRRGILEKVRTFNTLDLPALAQGKVGKQLLTTSSLLAQLTRSALSTSRISGIPSWGYILAPAFSLGSAIP